MVQGASQVTLLFTDIEGSTRLWEVDPAAMSASLARHDVLLRTVIERAGGRVFKTIGDAFCAAFVDPAQAVVAAVEIQRSVGGEAWPAGAAIRVRVGVHSGMCEHRGGDFFGPPVNRVARLQAAAHGGQVLLSAVTAGLAGDGLATEVELRDLGEHRLKDLRRPERVFQVCAAGLATEFPPLRSLDNPALRHNLPVQASGFVGRDAEIAALRQLLGVARMVTLTGAGGVGKTRLALQVATELLDGSGDGVWLVELAALAASALVASTVATALGVREEPGRAAVDTLADALGDRALLVVLDNCEHLIAPAAELAHSLVARCPNLVVLATSREPLGVPGEYVVRVPSLTVPEVGETDAARIARSDAVALFVERAAAQRSGFVLDGGNAAAIGSVCRRLDGIPLAIELAAVRLRHLAVTELEARLDQRFRLLTGGPRTSLPRQQTLRALIDWSYELLSPDERALLARLSVFAGGFDLAAAEAVCAVADVDPFDVVGRLGELVDKSLVQADESAGEVRYRLMETIRAYAAARLSERGERELADLRRAHRDHYLAAAEAAESQLYDEQQLRWLDRLELEHDNLRAALAYCLTDPDSAPGLRLAAALTEFRRVRGHGLEARRDLFEQLERPNQDQPKLRARALSDLGMLCAQITADYPAALRHGKQAHSIALAEGDDLLAARALGGAIAFAHLRRGELEEALAAVESAVALARPAGDLSLTARTLMHQGIILAELGRDALPAQNEALALFRQFGDRVRATALLSNIASDELAAGDLASARAHGHEGLQLAREVRDFQGATVQLLNLGLVAHLSGDQADARRVFSEALDLARRGADRSCVTYALLGFALVRTAMGDPHAAATLHGAVDALFDQLGEQPEAVEAGLRDVDHARVSAALGAARFEAAYQAGRALALDEALALAEPVTAADPV